MQHSLRLSSLAASLLVYAFILAMPNATHAAQVTITITDNAYSPQNVTAKVGDTVTWVNNGGLPHTVTANNGSFDSGTIQPGQSFSATFNGTGTYAFHCNFHTGMTGTLSVVSSVTPTPTVNTTTNNNAYVAQLQAQAQALLAQVAALQAQLGRPTTVTPVGTGSNTGVGTDSSSCPLIGRSLHQGISGDDVLRLQQFLARDSSIYPEAITSGYYGTLTERAVQRWQVKYNIVSSGSPATTGYGVVGPRTAAAIALLCTTGSYGGVSGPATPTQPTVGGYITVTPISGAAPLTVNVTATVNTPASCAATIYSLDFGDGTGIQQIPVSSGLCAQVNQTYPHTYKYGGTYQVRLFAGAHSTFATVTVSGTPPPQYSPDIPRESFGISPTSGSAPLTVTFSGIVNSNDAGFCVGGCASVLDFGDGTAATVNLPASVGGWLNYTVTHTYSNSGGYKATLYQGGAGSGQPIVGSATIIVGVATPPDPSSYSYSPPTIGTSGADSLTFNIQFDLPSSCAGYQLRWGDSSSDVIQNDGGSSCTQTPTLKTLTHTYASSGDYTILLKRGATLTRSDDLSITIQ